MSYGIPKQKGMPKGVLQRGFQSGILTQDNPLSWGQDTGSMSRFGMNSRPKYLREPTLLDGLDMGGLDGVVADFLAGGDAKKTMLWASVAGIGGLFIGLLIGRKL